MIICVLLNKIFFDYIYISRDKVRYRFRWGLDEYIPMNVTVSENDRGDLWDIREGLTRGDSPTDSVL